MNNVISVGLFRVSGDSKYLDMIFDCPQDYYFDSLKLEVRFVEQSTFKSKFFDLSDALFDTTSASTCTIKKKHWTVRLPLDKLEITVPAIYIATLHASPVFTTVLDNGTFKYALPCPYTNSSAYEVRYNTGDNAGLVYEKNGTDPFIGFDGETVLGKIFTNCCGNDCTGQLLTEIEDTMICSDVNYAYRCMLDDLLKEGRCESISDDAIRKYLLLYGHQAALAVEDMETAEAYFKLIGNYFNKCAVKDRPAKHAQPCNCGR